MTAISDPSSESTLQRVPSSASTVSNPPSLESTLQRVPTLLFAVPPNDPDFARIPHECRVEVRLTLARLRQIHAAKNKTRERERIASGLNDQSGSARTLKRHYYAYTSTGKEFGSVTFPPGDWRCVVDWAKAGPRAKQSSTAADTLPAEFVSKVWHRLCDRHQRVISSARRELVQIWRTGFDNDGNRWKSIAGYNEWPVADPHTGLPAGWTERNLYRYAPDDFERQAARVGIQSASALGLKNRTSRVGLRVLERVEFDDHEFNVKIMFPGQLRASRPRSFGAAEVLCSHLYKHVSKPTFWDEDEQAKKVLTETDFMWFVIACLCDEGYRVDERGTTLVVEHGTAALRDELAQRIFDHTGGKVRVARSGRFHKSSHGGQFATPSGGNPRFKAVIECFWRLFDDRLDSLPGQVGRDRNHAPEELERADSYVAKLLKAAAALDPERAAELILPRLTWQEFSAAVFERAADIACDPNHEIEGWERCGFLTKEFRQSPTALEWHPISDLPRLLTGSVADHSALVTALSSDLCNRTRRLSRLEAWQREYHRDLQAGLVTRLAPELVPAIVGPRHALKCNGSQFHTVRNGVIAFQDSRIDPDPLAFLAIAKDGTRIPNGEKFICYVNPMSPAFMVACDSVHRVVAVFPLVPRPAINDAEAVKQNLGLQRSWFARALAPMRDRHAPDAAALDFMRQHNSAILAGGQTESEKQRSKTLSRAALSPETLLDAEPASVHAESPSEDRSASSSTSSTFDPSELL